MPIHPPLISGIRILKGPFQPVPDANKGPWEASFNLLLALAPKIHLKPWRQRAEPTAGRAQRTAASVLSNEALQPPFSAHLSPLWSPLLLFQMLSSPLLFRTSAVRWKASHDWIYCKV